jgi:phenylpropionate dioxygenase-like ring-hydroxylating dioxygenase large terminal subunit
MAIAEKDAAKKRSALPVPYAMELPDRVPKERYLDPDFYAMEAELLWPRVWQMACRLEEIPQPHDYVEYEFLDQSVIVLRTDDMGVRAFQNACRHRGVEIVKGSGTCANGFTCPFHGWCYGLDGKNTHVAAPRTFSEHNLQPGDIDLVPVRCEVWGGCAWINLDADAPPLRQCLEPAATMLDAWKAESLRTEWWLACRLDVNWRLAIEAFVEMYHVVETHPQLIIPTRFGSRSSGPFDPAAYIDADIQYLRAMSEGMAGMVHDNDVRVAESLRDVELPDDRELATATWNRTLNDAVVGWHRDRGADIPDLNELDAQGINLSFFHCFPHYFVLPMYSSASSYRFRPLGPEETLMEIWSLTRYPEGEQPEIPAPPEPWEANDPRWPPIPAQDFSNMPRQQKGLHAKGFEYMRLSSGLEGHISNFERIVDGFLAGLPHERLLPALQAVNVYPFDKPIADLGF